MNVLRLLSPTQCQDYAETVELYRRIITRHREEHPYCSERERQRMCKKAKEVKGEMRHLLVNAGISHKLALIEVNKHIDEMHEGAA